MLYFGSFEGWVKEHNLTIKEATPFIKSFIKDIKMIGNLIYNDNPEIQEEIRKRKQLQKKEKYNAIGSVVSYYLQEHEIQILETIYKYCNNNNLIKNNICVLCADGIMIQKRHFKPELLELLTLEIKSKLNFDLKFKNKLLDEGYTKELIEKNQIKTSEFWEKLNLASQSFYAELYFEKYKDVYIYNSNSGWYEYNNMNILYKTTKAPLSLLNNITKELQQILNEYKNELDCNAKNYLELIKLHRSQYIKLGTSKFIEGVIDYLKLMYNNNDIEDLVDSDINLVAFNNMVFDMNENTFREIEKNDFIMKTTKYDINTIHNNMINKDIMKLLFSIFNTDEMVNYYLLTTASTLITNRFESLYIHTGIGGNGKGLLSSIIEKAFGDYFYQVPNTFLTTNFQGEAPNSSLYNCKGKRYVLITEPAKGNNKDDDVKFNVEFVKSITGGDTITTRQQHGTNISYKPLFTPFLQCNNKPDSDKLERGITRRFKILPYENKFVDKPTQPNEKIIDYTLKDRINDVFINEFMLILLDTIKNNFDENNNYKKIIQPNKVQEATNEYFDDINKILPFLQNYIKPKEGSYILVEDLLTHFKENGMQTCKPSKFKEMLKFNDYVLGKKPNSNDKKASREYVYNIEIVIPEPEEEKEKPKQKSPFDNGLDD